MWLYNPGFCRTGWDTHEDKFSCDADHFKDDLLEELEELEQEELEEKLLDVGPSVSDELPSVPTAEPVKPKPGTLMHYRRKRDNISVFDDN